MGSAREPLVREAEQVIARLWRGWATPRDASEYHQIFDYSVRPHLESIEGFAAAQLLRRELGDEVEFLALSFFTSMDAIHTFAGPDAERALVSEPARDVLKRFEQRVAHYTVTDLANGVRPVRTHRESER